MIAFVVPGRLNQLTGGYIYDAHIVAGLKRLGHRVAVKDLSRGKAARVFASLPDNAVVIVDGLAGGVLPHEIARESHRLKFIALVHHPLAHETGISKADARRLWRSERETLQHMRHVVVTSPATASLLRREYAVNARRVTCIEPGTDRAPASTGSGRSLLSVGTLTPRKGHVALVRALARLKHLEWTLTCVGSLTRDPNTVRRVRAEIRKAGLETRIALVGETSSHRRLQQHYARAGVFVLATEYEGYGMAVAEAIASGVPVVSTPTGAIRQMVGRDAGILVAPRNAGALTKALERMLTDERTRRRFRAGARRKRRALPSWPQAVRRMAAVVRKVAAE